MSIPTIFYPVKFTDLDASEVECFENENELLCSLEWFDSIGGDENATLEDARGRKFLAKVAELKLIDVVFV